MVKPDLDFKCKLCGATFRCDNHMWFATCHCAQDRPESLKLAQENWDKERSLCERTLQAAAERLREEADACNATLNFIAENVFREAAQLVESMIGDQTCKVAPQETTNK